MVDKLVIADQMIEEFLDSHRYFSALNLAGVAEELYGKYIHITGGVNAQQEGIKVAKSITKFDGAPEKSFYEWKKIMKYGKNAVKHIDSENERYIEIDAEDEARSMITCALSNHYMLDRDVTPIIQRFYKCDHGKEK